MNRRGGGSQLRIPLREKVPKDWCSCSTTVNRVLIWLNSEVEPMAFVPRNPAVTSCTALEAGHTQSINGQNPIEQLRVVLTAAA